MPGAPLSVQLSNATTNSSIITLTWSPPLVSERYGLTIYGYIINCSTDSGSLLEIKYTDILNVTVPNLYPFESYNCCIAANSSHGSGRVACVICECNTYRWQFIHYALFFLLDQYPLEHQQNLRQSQLT